MPYNSFAKVRKYLKTKYQSSDSFITHNPKYPMDPAISDELKNANTLNACALRFIHENCEDLRFDSSKESEFETGKFTGKSADEGQIPYNMEMDIDRLCLEKSVERFLITGSSNEAFDVYFCYLEIFVGNYSKIKKMIELLSEYENNGSSLLMKHRDHYSHSVYVFILGLAIFESNPRFRAIYNKYYGLNEGKSSAHHFLRYWGLASLFHDVGYPFELPFEQVESYFDIDKQKRKENIYLSYNRTDRLTMLRDDVSAELNRIYGTEGIMTTDELFAHDIYVKLGDEYGKSEEYISEKIRKKPIQPDDFDYFMDHAYFSANLIFRYLYANGEWINDHGFSSGKERDRHIRASVDAMTAVILHNSLYKYEIMDTDHPLKPELHPLAYILMLCDELQSWDRVAYGRNSKTRLDPFNCVFDFSNGKIIADYIFDESEKNKIDAWEKDHKKDSKKKLGSYSDYKTGAFRKDILKIVDIGKEDLIIDTDIAKHDFANKHLFLSGCSFIHLYLFAVKLNQLYNNTFDENTLLLGEAEKSFEADFGRLSLEYKLSNINQAKHYAEMLDNIGCFYTDRAVAYDKVSEFTTEECTILGICEHERWLREHYEMGWALGDALINFNKKKTDREKKEWKQYRECSRCHNDMIAGEINFIESKNHFKKELDDNEKLKDVQPMKRMMTYLNEFDGIRIYRLPNNK